MFGSKKIIKKFDAKYYKFDAKYYKFDAAKLQRTLAAAAGIVDRTRTPKKYRTNTIVFGRYEKNIIYTLAISKTIFLAFFGICNCNPRLERDFL